MFTIKEIERQVRVKLLDTYEDNYRFKPTEIFDARRPAYDPQRPSGVQVC